MQIPNTAFTHGGSFHADDVFSAALLTLCRPDIRILRGFAVPPDFDGLVFDIGGGRFDHHMKNSPVRPNGVPYAAFGLLWEAIGERILCGEDAKKFDREFVRRQDESDNTCVPHEIAAMIHDFNPTWQESVEEQARMFSEAVDLAV